MNDDSSKKPRKRRGTDASKARRTRPDEVEMTFWTFFDKREEVRTIRQTHGRTFKSLLNEAVDLLITKYNPP